MLETLSIRRYFLGGSDNSFGAGNQQERPAQAGILRDYTPDSKQGDDIVRPAWRHAELDGNVQARRKVSNNDRTVLRFFVSLSKTWLYAGNSG